MRDFEAFDEVIDEAKERLPMPSWRGVCLRGI